MLDCTTSCTTSSTHHQHAPETHIPHQPHRNRYDFIQLLIDLGVITQPVSYGLPTSSSKAAASDRSSSAKGTAGGSSVVVGSAGESRGGPRQQQGRLRELVEHGFR